MPYGPAVQMRGKGGSEVWIDLDEILLIIIRLFQLQSSEILILKQLCRAVIS